MNFRWCVLLLYTASFSSVAEDAALSGQQTHVARAQFTTAIENREPVDRVTVLSPPANEIFFFTDLRELEGHTVVHRWKHRGEVVSRVPFEVGGPRWRVFSKKVLKPEESGEWSVTVVDDNGWPMYVELFRYEPESTALPQAVQASE